MYLSTQQLFRDFGGFFHLKWKNSVTGRVYSSLLSALGLMFMLCISNVSFGQTYYNMSTGNYNETFTSWATPATGVNWSSVATASVGTIPVATNMTVSSAAFSTGTAGGLQNGTTNIQFLSTGNGANTNGNSVAFDLNLNFTGRNAGFLSFNAAQVTNGTGNRGASLKVYYSLNGTSWTELTATNLPFNVVNGTASAAAINIALPSALNNQSTVKLRFYNYNGPTSGTTGNRPKISVDDVVVTSTGAYNNTGANIVNGGVNFVGQPQNPTAYAQPTNCTAGDYRVLNYRRVSTTTNNTQDGRGQWFTTVLAQSAGGNAFAGNYGGGSNNGFLFTSGGGCGATGNFNDKWNFGGVGQAALNAVNGTTLNSTTDMGLNMSTAGYYSFSMKDVYNTNGPAFYVGYTANPPVNIVSTSQTSVCSTTATVTATIDAAPSTGEVFYLRYRSTTNDFSASTSQVLGTVSGTTVTFNLTGLTNANTYYYYILSTTHATYTSLSEVDKSLSCIRYLDNSGSNYSFTTANTSPTITVQPSNSTSNVGSSTTYTVTATNAATYQWQYATTVGGTYANVASGIPAGTTYAGNTSATLTVATTTTVPGSAYFYRCVVTACSNSVNSNGAQMIVYCAATGNTTFATGTTLVNYAGINNSTPTKTAGYNNYTAQSASVTAGQANNITINVNTAGGFTTFTRVYIDWDQNGVFNTTTGSAGGSGETYLLGSANSVTNGATSLSPLSITVPSAAVLGNTRMRVVTRFASGGTDPFTTSSMCLASTDAEVEDYNVTIAASVTPTITLGNNSIAAGNIAQGSTNNPIYSFAISPTVASATLTGLSITTTGSYVSADVTNLKCYYQTSSTFSAGTATLLSTLTTPGVAGSKTFPSFTSQTIANGATGYIFITADIPCAATLANTIAVNAVTGSNTTFSLGTATGTPSAGNTQTVASATPLNATSLAASSLAASSAISWVNPTGCYDEIMIVAAPATNTGTPTGNGSAYTASLTYGSGTVLGNGFVAYKGATSPQTVTGLTNGTTYYFKIFTRLGSVWSSGTEVNATPAITYCASTGPATVGSDYFTNFSATVGGVGITNTSTYSANGYGNFTAQSVTQAQLGTVNYSMVSPGIGNGSSFGIFVDWNQDGDFSDAGESAYNSGGNVSVNPTGSFSVPAGATLGATRMRVVVQDATATVVSCNSAQASSETEDYTFIVTAPVTPTIVLSTNAVGSGNIAQGTTNNPIYSFAISPTVASATLTGLSITTTGSYVSADVTNLKCYYQTSSTFSAGTATLLSTLTAPGAAGSKNFPSFTNQTIASGATGYIFITADIPCAATLANTISVNAVTGANTTFSLGTATGTPLAGNTQTVSSATPLNATSAAASSLAASSAISWVNPTGCYDQVLIVAAPAANTGSPTGDGSAYTGSLTYGSGTALGNGFVVFKGTTSPQTVTGLTNGTTYYFKIFTRLGSVWSSGTEVSATPSLVYCTASLHTGYGPDISNITLNTLNNTSTYSGISPGYVNYAAGVATTTLTQGLTYTGNLTVALGSSGYTGAITSIWIDYNQNGTFDASEWVQPFTSATSGSFIINVPANATLGLTKMRIRARGDGNTNGSTDACSSFGSGETEDYTITIAAPCSAPTTQAAIGAYTNTTSNAVTVNWTRGNGTAGVIVVGRLISTLSVEPTSGTTYTANTIFGSGNTTGTGNFVVYNGTGTSVDVTGLSVGSYVFSVYEYNTTGICYKVPASSSTFDICPTITGTPTTVCATGSGNISASTTCVAFANSGTTLSGTWNAGTDLVAFIPTGGIANSTTCSFNTSVTSNYTVRSFQVSTTGSYTFTMSDNTNYDGMAYLTTGAFQYGTCPGTGTWIIGDDDGGVNDEPVMTTTLTAGVTYSLISTTWGSTSGTYSGTFNWTITPPAGGQIMLSPAEIQWYAASTGGSAIWSGAAFNPVGVTGSGLANTNTAGTTTYYAACSIASNCRTAVNFTVNPSPTATWASTATAACQSASAQTTTLAYTATTNSPISYSITWNASPTNSFATVTNQANTFNAGAGTITLNIPAGTAAGTYTGTITVANANGCVSTGTQAFTITVNPAPSSVTITPSASICANDIATLTASSFNSGTYNIGSGTIANSVAANTPYRQQVGAGNQSRVQYLITKAELNAAGINSASNITSLAFNVVTVGSGTMTSYSIGIVNTSLTVLTATYQSPAFTTVYSGTNILPVTGVNTYTFSTPFAWDGTSNILINICHQGAGGTSSTVSVTTPSVISTTSGGGASQCSTTTGGAIHANRPTMILGATTIYPITWSPTTDLYTNAGATTGNEYTGIALGTVYVKPSSTQTYTATATLGTCTTTNTTTVTVNSLSVAPTSITGTTTICEGASTTLTVAGGTMGTGATVEWFTGSCGGTSAGTGNSITVSPTSNETYYARYAGTCNTTTCASVTVTVNTLSVAASSISATNTTICQGASTTLNVVGGSLGTGADWKWYSGLCGGTLEGTGLPLTVSPSTTTTYYLRAEGTCNNTACVTITINVTTPIDWGNIQTPTSGNMCLGGSFDVYGQVYKANITDPAGQAAGMTAQLGYSTSDTDPSTWSNWSTATFNIQSGNNDEFKGTISGLAVGIYYYAYRYLYNGCTYYYAGTNGTWNGSSSINGVLNVLPHHAIALTSGTNTQTVCENVAIADIVYTLSGGATGANVSGLPSGVNANVSGTTLTISGTPTTGGTYNYTITTTGNACTTATLGGTITVNSLIDWANLQSPPTATICPSGSVTIYGQLYEPGLTVGAGQGAGVVAEIGYSTANTNPNTWTNWTAATYNAAVTGSNDEYQGTLSGLSAGTYYYAYRYSLNGCAYQYGGTNGFWNGTSNVNGVLTVEPNHTLTLTSGAATQSICQNTALSTITYTLGGGATGADVTGLPTGVSASVSGNTLTISGTASVSGSFAYSITTTGNSCTIATASGNISVVPALSLIPSGTNVLCNGNSTGAASVSASGGTGTYSYSWYSGGSNSSISGLLANTYSVLVTSGVCSASTSYTVTQPTESLVATLSDKSDDFCQLNAGKVKLTVSGGVPSYNITWTPTHGSPLSPQTISSDGGFLVVDGLHGNTTYNFIVTDANGCHVP